MTIAFLKGHAMKRGTLMVLKRFVIMALGALGLGALTAGPTFAQIPAPDAYGDPQACAADIKVMKAAADKGKVQDNGLTPMQEAALTNMARSCAGDVGGGIAKARTLWQAAVDAKDELDDAQKAYDADDSARNKDDLDEATKDHTDAVTARNDYAGGGGIYEAVFEEEYRLAKATAASSAFTKAEAAADASETLRDTVELENYITDFAGYDTTGQAYEYETYTVLTTKAVPADGNTPAAEAVYTTYVRVKKQGGATVGPQLMVDADGNPDLDGNGDRQYEVPTALTGGLTKVNPDGTDDGSTSFELETDFDHDLDAETDGITFLRVGTATDVLEDKTIGGVNSEYKMAKDKLAATEKALAGNRDGTLTIQLTEDVRRAQAQYDFFAAQKARVDKSLAAGKLVVDRMGDNPATPNEVETDFDLDDTPYTVEDYEALTDLQDAETDAAEALKDAYDDRVAASKDLEDNQRDTQAYLDQLVALRQNEKAAADAAALKAEAEEETAAQKTANENLATANAQLKSFTDLQALDDANPVKALVNALVEADGSDGDDDGQALVDAIGSNYETASDAKTTATAAMEAVEGLSGDAGTVAENTAAIGALTAEDDPTTEGVDESGPVTANTTAIADHDMKLMAKKMYIDAIGEEMGFNPATGLGTGDEGMSRIDTNEAAIKVNSTAIDLLDGAVFAEEQSRIEDDMALGGRIGAEEMARAAADTMLDGRINAEETARMDADTMLGGRIDAEEMARMDADTMLGDRIDAEEMARMDADTMLGGRIDAEEMARMDADTMLGDRIDAEEMARMDADTMLGGRIDAEEMARMDADTMLGDRIDTEEAARMEADTMLDGLVASNTASISSNDMRITANAGDISTNKANIASNATAIMTNREQIDVVRAGVAASMALAGMPAINGRGISIGVGSFDGESAFAVGFQIQGEMASFKIGLTSGGGATGASAGVGFQF